MDKKEVEIPILGHPEGVIIVLFEEKGPIQTIEIEETDTQNGPCIPTVGHNGPGESVALKHIFHSGQR